MLRDSNFFPSHFSFFVSNFNGRRWMQELRNVIWWNMRSSWIFKSKIQHSFKKLPFCMIKITFLLIPFSFCIEAKHSTSPTPHPPHPHTPSSAKDFCPSWNFDHFPCYHFHGNRSVESGKCLLRKRKMWPGNFIIF